MSTGEYEYKYEDEGEEDEEDEEDEGEEDEEDEGDKTPWYDTREGLEAKLREGIDGIHAIHKARREAGYQRRERLSEWCLLGWIYTDGVGNFMPITSGAPVDAQDFLEYRPLPDVMSREEMASFTQHWTGTYRACLPPADATCDRCGRGWTKNNLRDVFVSGNGSMRHESCHQLMVIEDTETTLANLLRSAEIPVESTHLIPNEYCSDKNYFGPWMIASTPLGRLKLGWRKRVLNIDWSGTSLRVPPDTFESEEVTHASTYVHAWTLDKGVEYLRRIWQAHF